VAAVKEGKADKAALYEKLQRADVLRLAHLKARASTKYRGDTTTLIVVRVEKANPRAPPAALVNRLSVVSNGLLASAGARQAGAQNRRTAMRAAVTLNLASASAKRAAALKRVSMAQAAVEAKVKGRAARALVTRALYEGRRAHLVAQEHRLALNAAQNREAAATALQEKCALWRKREAEAEELYEARLRRVAKKGVIAVRASVNKGRREALRASLVQRAEALAKRCDAAAVKKESILKEVVSKAIASAAKRTSDS
jgi:hypothetical protein